MSEVLMVARMEIAPEKRAETLAAFEELVAATHANDAGCGLYSFHLDPEDDAHVYMIEKWESQEALDGHMTSEHIKAFGERGLIAGPSKVVMLQQAGFGDPALGTI
jgi:quinol monooxygenase YgiN